MSSKRGSKLSLSSHFKRQVEGVLYFVYPIFVFGIITFGGFWLAKWYYGHDDGPAVKLVQEETLSSAGNVAAAEAALLTNYVDAHGGIEALREARIFTYDGVITDGEEELRIFKASRGFGGDLEIELLDDGTEYNLHLEDGHLVGRGLLMVGGQVDSAIVSLGFVLGEALDPVADLALNGRGKITSIEHMSWTGFRAIHVCLFRADIELVSDIYLSESDLSILARTDSLADGTKRSYRYGGYEDVEGVCMPYEVKVSLVPGYQSRIRFRKIVAESKAVVDAQLMAADVSVK